MIYWIDGCRDAKSLYFQSDSQISLSIPAKVLLFFILLFSLASNLGLCFGCWALKCGPFFYAVIYWIYGCRDPNSLYFQPDSQISLSIPANFFPFFIFSLRSSLGPLWSCSSFCDLEAYSIYQDVL